eukprot:12978660-Alexandrium_andersonii.AAC.1
MGSGSLLVHRLMEVAAVGWSPTTPSGGGAGRGIAAAGATAAGKRALWAGATGMPGRLGRLPRPPE